MKSHLLILAVAVSFSTATLATPASVSVKFDNAEKYSDIDYYNGSKKKFQKRLFADLKEYLNEQAAKILPENVQLSLNFSDIDLAGRYDYVGTDHIRIARDIDYPRLKFSFKLTKDGATIKEAEASLKDMSYLRHNLSAKRHSLNSFYHEKLLLKKWLTKKIKPLVN